MDATNMIVTLTEGLTQNLLITILSVIVPLGLGILFTYLASLNRTSNTVFSWVSLPFECIGPISLLFVNYYMGFFRMRSGLLIAVLTFSICFLGYMPARYRNTESLLKNCIYNGLGLLSTVFKWSFCASMIGVVEMQRAANMILTRTGDFTCLWIPLICAFLFLLLIEVGRRLVKQFMK